MYKNVPIVIPSKGRFGSQVDQKTGQVKYQAVNIGKLYNHMLQHPEDAHRFYIAVEPDEVESYAATFDKWPSENILVLGAEDKGIGFSRGSILKYFQRIGCELFMMLDDDCEIMELKWTDTPKDPVVKPRLVRMPLVEVIDNMAEYCSHLDNSNVGIICTEYGQFGWSKIPDIPEEVTYKTKVEFTDVTYADCAVFIFAQKLKELDVMYENVPLKEDRDFCAQVYAAGLVARKLFRWQMDSPLNGKAAGGCQSWYRTDNFEHQVCVNLIEKWNGKPWVFPSDFRIENGNVVTDNEEEAKAYEKQTKECNLINFKPKKTCYNRVSDIKFWWNRIKMAVEGKLKAYPNFTKPSNVYPLGHEADAIMTYKQFKEQ